MLDAMNLLRALAKGGDVWMYLRSLWTDPWNAPQERVVTIDGVKFFVRRRTSDAFVIDEVLRRKVYGEPPRGVVLDLGANIGAYSLFAARTAEKIFAFEPESSTYAQLEKNIALNGIQNVTPFKKAVGGRSGVATLYKASSNVGAHSIANTISKNTENVEIVTLEEALKICGASHVNVLKVDIEGSEYELFENAPLDVLGRIDAIYMETHPVKGKGTDDIARKLYDAGFTVRFEYTRLSPFGMKMLFAEKKT